MKVTSAATQGAHSERHNHGLPTLESSSDDQIEETSSDDTSDDQIEDTSSDDTSSEDDQPDCSPVLRFPAAPMILTPCTTRPLHHPKLHYQVARHILALRPCPLRVRLPGVRLLRRTHSDFSPLLAQAKEKSE